MQYSYVDCCLLQKSSIDTLVYNSVCFLLDIHDSIRLICLHFSSISHDRYCSLLVHFGHMQLPSAIGIIYLSFAACIDIVLWLPGRLLSKYIIKITSYLCISCMWYESCTPWACKATVTLSSTYIKNTVMTRSTTSRVPNSTPPEKSPT